MSNYIRHDYTPLCTQLVDPHQIFFLPLHSRCPLGDLNQVPSGLEPKLMQMLDQDLQEPQLQPSADDFYRWPIPVWKRQQWVFYYCLYLGCWTFGGSPPRDSLHPLSHIRKPPLTIWSKNHFGFLLGRLPPLCRRHQLSWGWVFLEIPILNTHSPSHETAPVLKLKSFYKRQGRCRDQLWYARHVYLDERSLVTLHASWTPARVYHITSVIKTHVSLYWM